MTKRKRGYARGAAARRRRAQPRAHRAASPTTPARPGRCCPTSASSRSSRRRSARRCGASAASTASSSSRSSRRCEQWRYRNKLEYSFGTADDGGLVCGFHAPGRWERIEPIEDCLLASERGNAVREQVLAWCRERGPAAPGTAARRRAAAQPRRARGPAHRPAPGAPRHLPRDARRRRLADGASGATACSGRGRAASARRPPAARPSARRAPRRSRRSSAGCASASRPRRSSRRTPRWPSGSTPSRASTPALAGLGARLRPLLRDRHDRADDGRARRRAVGPGGRRGRRSPTRSPTRAATRSATRTSSPATSAPRCATSSSRPAAPTSLVVDPPRAGLSQKVVRRIIEAAPQRIVYVVLQPDDAGAERGPARRGRLRAAPRAPGRHVPADAAHRVRRAARAGLAPPLGPQDRLDVDDRGAVERLERPDPHARALDGEDLDGVQADRVRAVGASGS